MKIGQLSEAARTQVETIRFYEREGLLAEPKRTAGNYRIYDQTHLDRLLFIRHCRALDMTLDEIRVLLRFLDAPTENCSAVNALIDAHLGHVAARVKELHLLEIQLKSLQQRCQAGHVVSECGILNELTQQSRIGQSEAPKLLGRGRGL